MDERHYNIMHCKNTGKDEPQYTMRVSEDGITLRCGGCGKTHSHEIGFFAERYNKVFAERYNKEAEADD